MGTFDSFYSKWKKINFEQTKVEAVEESEEAMLEIIKDQLRDGRKGDGRMPEYSTERYVDYKRSLTSYKSNPRADLFVKGDIHDSIKLKVSGMKYSFISNNEIAGFFMTSSKFKKYGATIFDYDKISVDIAMIRVTNKYGELIARKLK